MYVYRLRSTTSNLTKTLAYYRLEFKHMEVSYAIEWMFKVILPKLKHGNDGLIFTCRESAYRFGTDEKMYL